MKKTTTLTLKDTKHGVNQRTNKAWTLYKYEDAEGVKFSSFTKWPEGVEGELTYTETPNGQWTNRDIKDFKPSSFSPGATSGEQNPRPSVVIPTTRRAEKDILEAIEAHLLDIKRHLKI